MSSKQVPKTGRVPLTTLTWTSALFGGLVQAYLLMALITAMTPAEPAIRLLGPMILGPLAWSLCTAWIFHAPSPARAARKCILGILVLTCLAAATFLRG